MAGPGREAGSTSQMMPGDSVVTQTIEPSSRLRGSRGTCHPLRVRHRGHYFFAISLLLLRAAGTTTKIGAAESLGSGSGHQAEPASGALLESRPTGPHGEHLSTVNRSDLNRFYAIMCFFCFRRGPFPQSAPWLSVGISEQMSRLAKGESLFAAPVHTCRRER